MPHKKNFYFLAPIFSFVLSCSPPDKYIPPQIQTYNSNDPIARALGKITQPYPSHGQFDVGVVLERYTFYFDSVTSAYAAMAFDTNQVPAKADSSLINERTLIWTEYYEPGVLLNIYSDSTSFGEDDSLSFSYKNFIGESYNGVAGIAPPFKNLVFPDTISESEGFKISYSNFSSNDSIVVKISFSTLNGGALPSIIDTLPDTGTLVIGPELLPHDTAVFHLGVYLSREKLESQTSPRGKRIGIYSIITEFCIAVVKP